MLPAWDETTYAYAYLEWIEATCGSELKANRVIK